MKAGVVTAQVALLALLVLACGGSELASTAVLEPAAPASDAPASQEEISDASEPAEPESAVVAPVSSDEPAEPVVATPVRMASTVHFIRTERGAPKDFALTFADGEVLRLSDLKGSVVVVNFWGSWCPPCRWEMPFFEEIWREYRDQEVVFIGIAVPPDNVEDARDFAEQIGVTYPLGLDATGEILIDFGVTEFPTTFIFDRDGNEARKFNIANKGVLHVYIKGQL